LLWRTREAHHPVKDVETVPMIRVAIEAIRGMSHFRPDVRSGWLQPIVNGPEMHRWHPSYPRGYFLQIFRAFSGSGPAARDGS
jgi:hypothetical protein